MIKRSINLILPIKPEPPLLKKLRVFLPIAAGIITFIFLIIFISTLIYLKIRNDEYDQMLTQSQLLESKITSQKSEEGFYILTYRMLSTIEKILSRTTTFNGFTSDVAEFNSSPLTLQGFSITSKGAGRVSVYTQDANALTDLVNLLSKADEEKKYSNIIASDIVRDSHGLYFVNLTFKPNSNLLK